MKRLIFFICLFWFGCSSDAQQKSKSNTVVDKGFVQSVQGIDLTKYEIEVSDFYHMNLNSITKDHVLCYAVDECESELIKDLISKGANVNTYCNDDALITGLGFCYEDIIELIELFINKGADINGADQENSSLLSYAISADNFELVDYILLNGGDKNHRDNNHFGKCLPIHACESLKMLQLLEKKGFKLDEVCSNGENLLHLAVKGNFIEMINYMVDHKLIDKNQKDNSGKTPLDYAKEKRNKEIQMILK